MKAVVGGVGVGIAEQFWLGLLFVAANSNRDHVAVAVADGQLKYLLRGFGSEVADGVENPQHRDAEVALPTLASAFQSFKDRREILIPPQADSHRNVDLGVQNVFFLQLLHEAVGNEFVVLRRAQMLGDSFEGHQETVEV